MRRAIPIIERKFMLGFLFFGCKLDYTLYAGTLFKDRRAASSINNLISTNNSRTSGSENRINPSMNAKIEKITTDPGGLILVNRRQAHNVNGTQEKGLRSLQRDTIQHNFHFSPVNQGYYHYHSGNNCQHHIHVNGDAVTVNDKKLSSIRTIMKRWNPQWPTLTAD